MEDDVESGRKALRAGREIEAVARSVPDLTDPDPDLNFEENLDGRLLSLGVSVVVGSPRIRKPDVRPFFLAFANLGAHVSSTIIPVLPSCPGLFPPDPSRTAMHFLTLWQASPQFLGVRANTVGKVSATTKRRLLSCMIGYFLSFLGFVFGTGTMFTAQIRNSWES